jgi:hypothetical protein
MAKRVRENSEIVEDALDAGAASKSEYNRENVIALARTLRVLRKKKLVQFKNMLDQLGLARPSLAGKTPDEAEKEKKSALARVQQRFSRWIQTAEEGEKWRLVNDGEYADIREFLKKNKKFQIEELEARCRGSAANSALFHEFASWIGMPAETTDDLRREFEGTYQIIRHSKLQQGDVFLGRLTISYDEMTNSIMTKEEYKTAVQGELDSHNGTLKGNFYKGKNHYIIMSKDTSSKELQYIFINHVVQGDDAASNIDMDNQEVDNKGITRRMAGVVFDIEGSEAYSTRIAFIRNDNITDDMITTVKFDTFKSSEKARLEIAPILTKGQRVAVFQ